MPANNRVPFEQKKTHTKKETKFVHPIGEPTASNSMFLTLNLSL